jgi:hypothetical protein
VTYDFKRFCCATRYLFDAPEIRRKITLEMLSKHHDADALQASLDKR